MNPAIIRGTIISAEAPHTLRVMEDGWLIAENGIITGVFSVLPDRYAGAPVEDYRGDLVLQAPVDLHLHAPQYPMLCTGMDLPLLDWLDQYVFPEEARFQDPDYARDTCRRLAGELAENGTTRICIFSSLHRAGTRILMEELERAGIGGYAGKVNMDRNSGSLTEDTAASLRETLAWLDACGDFRKIRPVLTPRFVPACSRKVLDFLGGLSRERHLPVQSHLSESRAEMAWVRELRPECERYWEVYAASGLWHERTLMAHCVWSDEAERQAIREYGVTAVHCASSNRNLCSGTAPVRAWLEEGMKVALGSDIAGGDTLSMFDVAADTVRASKVRYMMDGSAFLKASEAWYLATSGGAAFFGDRPGFAPGNPLHALVLRDRDLTGSDDRPMTGAERLERALYRRQLGAIRAVWSGGEKIYDGGKQSFPIGDSVRPSP